MNYAKKNITGPAKRYYQPGAEAKALNGYDQLNSLLKKKIHFKSRY